MSAQSKNKIRLYCPVFPNKEKPALGESPSHYLANVMRAQNGDVICLFNEIDGEYEAEITQIHKKQTQVRLRQQVRQAAAETDLWLIFAPLKKDRTDFVVEKATELGVSRIIPVFTEYTACDKIRVERWQAQATEAAEQCRRLSVPAIEEGIRLDQLLAGWEEERVLLLADESGQGRPAAEVCRELKGRKAAVLIGPEGGFSESERQLLYQQEFVRGLSLGPRILRADTATAAALSIWQAEAGDWQAGEK